MSVSGVGAISASMMQSILDMRKQLDSLEQQLGTGMKSDTYSGLGLSAGLTVGLNAQLAAITNFTSTINTVGTRVSIAQTALDQMTSFGTDVQNAVSQNGYTLDSNGQTTAQNTALSDLGSFLGLLNTQVGNRYIFSGNAADQPSVDTMDHILNGNGAQAGLKQVIDERNQADLGDGLGRLQLTQPATNEVDLSEDVAGSPFGFKLAGVNSSLTGATVTGPSGSPQTVSVTLGSNPNPGDTIQYQFTLPDGTSENITLKATTDNPPGPNQFTIGATPDDTADNLKAALDTSVRTLASTALSAASAVEASNNFFDNPPQRVSGSPLSSATALVNGTSADTVMWYTGGTTTGSIRSTATAQIDQSITVSYGTQANEQGIRWVLQNIATLAAVTYSPSDPNASAAISALDNRVNANLGVPAGTQSIQDIETDLAGAQSSMKSATSRQQQTTNTLTNLLQNITTVPQEQVGAQILAMQTSLSASLQVTAMLSKISLVNYLS
ncbi:MAG TPA: flagellar biosynthesis protein FlgL [Pseudolabrys sp.]|nr:flagellar biosynthesis protein FlgL [Pseudolabrys sp.]